MRRARIATIAMLAFALSLPACASSGSAADGDRTGTAAGDQMRLTSGEIQAAGLPNAYELVNRLRRAWLRRDAITGNEVRVYENNREIGAADVLRRIPSVEIAELRYYDSDAATARWGNAVESSVIEVVRQ